ncbi:putative quinol monooxygenase [Phaeacidiphilus oryzae]|uniref:putative quinol monooxygenase n=1 Tax=Phaeacidiphilus oryzae TaxID=348818 RepID=UPI000565E5C7|nr:antibiotic biosynthesis monooxygenase [Phaeacidiphilus oryzae]
MSIFVRARFEVGAERRREFEELVRALRKQAADEPGTSTFRFFSAGPGSYLVLEEYTDPQAAAAHNERAAALLAGVTRCAELLGIELYGDIGPELGEWARTQPRATTYPELPL